MVAIRGESVEMLELKELIAQTGVLSAEILANCHIASPHDRQDGNGAGPPKLGPNVKPVVLAD